MQIAEGKTQNKTLVCRVFLVHTRISAQAILEVIDAVAKTSPIPA